MRTFTMIIFGIGLALSIFGLLIAVAMFGRNLWLNDLLLTTLELIVVGHFAISTVACYVVYEDIRRGD